MEEKLVERLEEARGEERRRKASRGVWEGERRDEPPRSHICRSEVIKGEMSVHVEKTIDRSLAWREEGKKRSATYREGDLCVPNRDGLLHKVDT